MNSSTDGTEPEIAAPRRLRKPGRAGRAVIATAIGIVLIVAGVGAYLALSNASGETTLVIYTYSSLFGGACGQGGAAGEIFGNFSAAHHVRIEVECPSGTLVSTLDEQKNDPVADLVVGLDEITAPEAQANHLILPYTSPDLANVSPSLVAHLSPGGFVTPYEYGYLAIDYANDFFNATDGAIANGSLTELAANSSWANQFVYEDPTLDITGQEFLAEEVLYYQDVLHEDWTSFWTSIEPHAIEAPSWDVAYDEEFGQPYQLLVSYTTDPAAQTYYGGSPWFNATVLYDNGTPYSWETLYGAAIVNGSSHIALDQEFINYLLSGSVQSQIPYNEWEYPANTTVPLPSLYTDGGLIDPSSIVALNDFTTPSELAQNFTSSDGWLSTWQSLGDG